MKKFLLFNVTAVLLLSSPVGANLMVYEYNLGEKVTYDDVTGYYWYYDLTDFVNMTYSQQMTAIGNLGNYGNIAGGWHMASLSEIQSLLIYSNPIPTSFASTYVISGTIGYYGRFDSSVSSGTHGMGAAWNDKGNYILGVVPYMNISDGMARTDIGAWVVSDQAVVPVPGTVLLGIIGLGVAGLKLRKHA